MFTHIYIYIHTEKQRVAHSHTHSNIHLTHEHTYKCVCVIQFLDVYPIKRKRLSVGYSKYFFMPMSINYSVGLYRFLG